ncbi:hypothetical protein BDV25DRAFT_136008 [Aspergillus avenaceus]|uniref:Uncharacterized protein n=1 Tax=Aspergillus avenaceus TaxID=36643 RepID=A0A5N6U6P1_ASPAV|nr:hypothetical protein BDV25DRAFT_136008 [Aspergillus avenaceus]
MAAPYISIPIIDEFVRFVEEDSQYEDSVKAMALTILSHYFQAMSGYSVISEAYRNNGIPDFVIVRIQRRFPGDRSIVDHTMVEAKKTTDSLNESMEQLEGYLENANTEFGRCYGLLVRGPYFMFYEYHKQFPINDRYVPWGPPNQPHQNTFHARHDSATIDWMLRHMEQNPLPPLR